MSATSAAAAEPAEVRCGEPVVADAVLDRDLDCPAGGPELTTGGVTLDLNGHAIRGSGAGVGITIRPSCSEAGEIVVENGSVSAFHTGIWVDHGCDHTVSTTVAGLVIAKNETGVRGYAEPARVGPTLLSGNTIRANAQNGVETAFIRPFHVVGNNIKRNGGHGVVADEDSIDRLVGNVVSRNGGHGAMFVDSVSDIQDNRFMRNSGTGLRVSERVCEFSAFYDISGNKAMHNGGGGMIATFECEDGVAPPPGGRNVAKHNVGFQCILIQCTPARGLLPQTRMPTAIRHSWNERDPSL